jgi:hypothetical protein
MKTATTILLVFLTLASFSQKKKGKNTDNPLDKDLEEVIFSMDQKLDSIFNTMSNSNNGNDNRNNAKFDSLVKINTELSGKNNKLVLDLSAATLKNATISEASTNKTSQLTAKEEEIAKLEAKLVALKNKEKENIEKEIAILTKEPSGISKGHINILEARISICEEGFIPKNTKALSDFKKARQIVLQAKAVLNTLYAENDVNKSIAALTDLGNYSSKFLGLIKEKNNYLNLLKQYCSESEFVKDNIELASDSYEKDRKNFLKGEIIKYADYPYLQKALNKAIANKGSNILKTAKHNCD